MKKLLFLFLIAILITSTVSAQRALKIKSRSGSEERIIKEGSKIRFKLHPDSAFIKGKISQVKEKSVVIYVNEEERILTEMTFDTIKVIRKSTVFHGITKGASAVLLPVGAFMFISGTLSTIFPRGTDQSDNAVLAISGAVITGIGLIPILINPKTYDLTSAYTLESILVSSQK